MLSARNSSGLIALIVIGVLSLNVIDRLRAADAIQNVRVRQADNWTQGPGPNFNFAVGDCSFPSDWSVVRGENIAWRRTLPETGQSAATVIGNRVFVTTMKPVDSDSQTGSDIVAWCFSSDDGKLVWKRKIAGGYQTKLSAPFGDASAPSPVADATRVWFLNPTGRLVCFQHDGTELWSQRVTSVARTQPILAHGNLILHHQVYLPDESGTFTHDNHDAAIEKWTQLQALDAATGKRVWLSECGVNMGCVPILQHLSDGTPVLMVGRGGGHGPPERPDGVSLVRADNGQTIWTRELSNFMSTQTYPIINDQALVFHKGEHLWLDAKNGKVLDQISIVEKVNVRRWTPEGRRTTTETLKQDKPRSITQQSNLLVGKYHYFRSYTRNYLGRIHVESRELEYLELPIQVSRTMHQPDQILWQASDSKMLWPPIKRVKGKLLRPNSVMNSRGFKVMGDARAQGSGWGHICAPIPTAFGDRLVVPLMSGLVFVIHADAERLDESAVLAMNDLGPLGDTFTRASITSDGKKAYAHTIKELIAIGSTDNRE